MTDQYEQIQQESFLNGLSSVGSPDWKACVSYPVRCDTIQRPCEKWQAANTSGGGFVSQALPVFGLLPALPVWQLVVQPTVHCTWNMAIYGNNIPAHSTGFLLGDVLTRISRMFMRVIPPRLMFIVVPIGALLLVMSWLMLSWQETDYIDVFYFSLADCVCKVESCPWWKVLCNGSAFFTLDFIPP